MPRFPQLRARGDRGPQIGPGTFDGRSSHGSGRPPVFDHLVWSRGDATPDIEVWCFLRATVSGQPFPADAYAPIDPPVESYHHAWLEKIPEFEEFVPPSSQPPIGNETELALKDYAVQRMLVKHNIQTAPSQWIVRVARPFETPLIGPIHRHFAREGVFEVRQAALSDVPVAWVWVADGGAREIWALYRLGEPGGFALLGTDLPNGQPFLATELKHLDVTASFTNGYALDILSYGVSIQRLKQNITLLQSSPVSSPNELSIHDYRIAAPV